MDKNFDLTQFIGQVKDHIRTLQDTNGVVYLDDIYQYISCNIEDIFQSYKPYLQHVFNYPTGQILPGSEFGDAIQKILSDRNLSILEFGCWNGLGSTRLCAEATKGKVYSIELNPFMVATCVKNLQPFPSNLNLIFGKVLNTENLKIDVEDSFLSLEFSDRDVTLGGLVEVVLLKSVPNILSLIPPKLDCLLLDGGVFMSFDEFLLLHRRFSKYLFLDDTSSSKCAKIYEFLDSSKDWELALKCQDRAAAIFKRVSHEGFFNRCVQWLIPKN